MNSKGVLGGVLGMVFGVAFIALLMWGIPTYSVWSAEMTGTAELRRAEMNRNIIIAEAEARLAAEKLNAEAEVARAKGAARAMEAVQEKLTEMYVRYLWVRTMTGNPNVIYIPTEAGLPILEVGRIRH